MEVPIIRDSRYLPPSKHAGFKPSDVVGRLPVEVHNSFGNELLSKALGKAMPKHKFCDVIRKQMEEFQLEMITDSFFVKDEEGIKYRVSKASYWALCYEEFDAVPDHNTSNIDAEAYWNKVSSMLMKMEILDIASYQNYHSQSCCCPMEMLTLDKGFPSIRRFWKNTTTILTLWN